MKKGFLILSIVLWTIIAIAVGGIMIYGLNGGFGKMANAGTLLKDQSISLSDIQNIVIDGSSQTMEVHKTSGNSINICQYGRKNTKEEKLFLVSTSEDTLHIYFNNTRDFNFFNFSFNEKLVIEIPEAFKGNLDVKASSGNVEIEDEFVLRDVVLGSSSGAINTQKNITADSLKVKASSGSININGNIIIGKNVEAESSSGRIKFNGTVAANALNASASSGDILCNNNITAAEEVKFICSSGKIDFHGNLSVKTFNAKTGSGRISLGNINVESYTLRSSSGSINADSISGSGQAETSSGSIQLSLENPKDNIDLMSSSGSIDITLEPSLQFTLDAQTSSGSIHTNFDTTTNDKNNKATAKIGNNPAVNITARASSGSIKIQK